MRPWRSYHTPYAVTVFQFSIGDARSKLLCRLLPIGKSFNSLLEMRADAWQRHPHRYRQRDRFNSLLEMRQPRDRIRRSSLVCSFNSLLEMPELRVVSIPTWRRHRVSILYWRCALVECEERNRFIVERFNSLLEMPYEY